MAQPEAKTEQDLQIEAEFDADQEKVGEKAPEAAAEPAVEVVAEPEYSEAETKARAGGWLPREEWDGDPEDWIGITQFNKTGGIIDALRDAKSELKHLKTTMDGVLEKNNLFHSQQVQMMKKEMDELKARRTQAIDLADVKEADRIQGEIDTMGDNIAVAQAQTAQPTQQAPQASDISPSVAAWNRENPWIEETSPKSAYAKTVFNNYLTDNAARGVSREAIEELAREAIKATDDAVAKEFPTKNPNRDEPPSTIRGRTTTRQAKGRLSMSDLTTEERKVYEEFKEDYKNQDEFLAAVKSSRV